MTRKLCIVISALSSVLMSSCDKSPPYDLTLLQPYSLELDKSFHVKEKLDPPYGVLFKTQDCAFLYFSSRHAANIKSPTFQGIKQIMEQFSPHLVLIEGIKTDDGISPTKYIQHIQRKCIPGWKCVEVYYAAYLASLKKIPFLGVEPTDSEIFETLQPQGYTKKDILFFYFSRQIPQILLEKQIHDIRNLKAIFLLFLSRYMERSEYSLQDYMTWLKEKLHREIPWVELIDPNFTAPIEMGHYLQKLSSRVTLLRDQHIVTVTLKNLAKYRKIVLVMGGSHYPVQKDILIKYLGNPTYFPMIELFSFDHQRGSFG